MISFPTAFMKIYLCVDFDPEDPEKQVFSVQPILRKNCGDRTPDHPVYKLAQLTTRSIKQVIVDLPTEELESLKVELRKIIVTLDPKEPGS